MKNPRLQQLQEWRAAKYAQSPVVDVERALYEALVDLRAVLWSEGYSNTHAGMASADKAIAFYESKGKPAPPTDSTKEDDHD
jgi:hypothetical protein